MPGIGFLHNIQASTSVHNGGAAAGGGGRDQNRHSGKKLRPRAEPVQSEAERAGKRKKPFVLRTNAVEGGCAIRCPPLFALLRPSVPSVSCQKDEMLPLPYRENPQCRPGDGLAPAPSLPCLRGEDSRQTKPIWRARRRAARGRLYEQSQFATGLLRQTNPSAAAGKQRQVLYG